MPERRFQSEYEKLVYARFSVENIEGRAKLFLGDLDNPQSHTNGIVDVVVDRQGARHLSVASVQGKIIVRQFKGDTEKTISFPLEIFGGKYVVDLTQKQGEDPKVNIIFPYHGIECTGNLDETVSAIGLGGLDQISRILHLDQTVQKTS